MNRSMYLVAIVLLLVVPHSFVPAAAAESVAALSLDAADAAFRARDWAKSAEMYAALAQENPEQGAFWYRLATAEYNLKRYDAAIPHYQRAIEDGFNVGTSYYNIGCCHALMNQAKPAIDAIDLAIKNDLRDRERLLREDHDLDSLRGLPEFQKRILPDVSTMSRTEGWRTDLDYLTRRVDETHYDPWRNISRKEWDAEIARISKAVPKMKDHEIAVALMVLMARLQDGHSGVFPPAEGANAFHALPIEFYDFPDGIYVRGANTAYADLVGKKLVRINDTPAQQVWDRIATTVPRDNTQGIRWQAARHLGNVEALNTFGIIPDVGGARVTVADASGKETTMDVAAISRADHLNNPRTTDWVDMADASRNEKPLWRRHKDKNYWYEYLKDRGMVYMGFNAVANQDGDVSLPDFAGQLFDFLKQNEVDILVIDVRTNHGGDNFLARNLMLNIISSDRINNHGHLFVITGRETFSACQNFCNWLDFDADVMFVGEPTGSKPNFVGEGNNIMLPYSGLIANASSRLWQNSVSEDRRPWIAPNLAADLTFDDYRNNRDPAMEAIFEYLGAHAEAPRH